MNQRETEKAIEAEVAHWPGASVSFEAGGKHPKAKLEFGGLIIRQAFPGTPGTSTSLLKTLADMRRALRKMDATRDTETTEADDLATVESVYRKPNPGREMRPDPVEREHATPTPSIAEKLADVGLVAAEEAGSIERGPDVAVQRETTEAEWQAQADAIEDGIYFRLPEDVYHRVKRYSTSGIQRTCASPGSFWRDSWMNPNPPKLSDEQEKRREHYRILGRAYHCARLEPDQLETRYCRKIDKADFEGVEGFLSNGDQIGAALADYGEAKKRAGESVLDQARRLEGCGYEGPIWPLEEARWKEESGGKVPISADEWENLLIDMERLKANREIAELLEGGQPEVSIFWTDRYGIKMKSRVDYLAVSWWDEFKTFDNSIGKPLKQAINDAVRFNRYHIQPVVYRDGIEAVRTGGLQIIGEATDDERALIAKIQIRPDELACWFIFQEKNGVPNVLAKRFPFFAVNALTEEEIKVFADDEGRREELRELMGRKTGLHIRALRDIDEAKQAFMLYSKVYPEGAPWAPINARGVLEDFDFNRHWLESTYD